MSPSLASLALHGVPLYPGPTRTTVILVIRDPANYGPLHTNWASEQPLQSAGEEKHVSPKRDATDAD